MLKDMLDWTGSLTLAVKMTLREATRAAVVGVRGRRVRRPPGVPPPPVRLSGATCGIAEQCATIVSAPV